MESTIDIFIKNFIHLANKNKTIIVISMKEIKLPKENVAFKIGAVKLKHGKISGEYFNMIITLKKEFSKTENIYSFFDPNDFDTYYLDEKEQLEYFFKFIGQHVYVIYNFSEIDIINAKLSQYGLNQISKYIGISIYDLLYKYNLCYKIFDKLDQKSICNFFKISLKKDDGFFGGVFEAFQSAKIFMHLYNIYKIKGDNFNIKFTKKNFIELFDFKEKKEMNIYPLKNNSNKFDNEIYKKNESKIDNSNNFTQKNESKINDSNYLTPKIESEIDDPNDITPKNESKIDDSNILTQKNESEIDDPNDITPKNETKIDDSNSLTQKNESEIDDPNDLTPKIETVHKKINRINESNQKNETINKLLKKGCKAYISGTYNPIERIYGYGCCIVFDDGKKKNIGGFDAQESYIPSEAIAGLILGVKKAIEFAISNNCESIDIYSSYLGIKKFIEGTLKPNYPASIDLCNFCHKYKSLIKINGKYISKDKMPYQAIFIASKNVKI